MGRALWCHSPSWPSPRQPANTDLQHPLRSASDGSERPGHPAHSRRVGGWHLSLRKGKLLMFGRKTNIPDSHPGFLWSSEGDPSPRAGPLYQRTQDRMQLPVSLSLPPVPLRTAAESHVLLRQRGTGLSQELRKKQQPSSSNRTGRAAGLPPSAPPLVGEPSNRRACKLKANWKEVGERQQL